MGEGKKEIIELSENVDVNGNKRSTIQARGEQVKKKRKGNGTHMPKVAGEATEVILCAPHAVLEIVPIEVVGLNQPGVPAR